MNADVAVVGAGIVGSCVAYELARSGASVVVFDPRPGQGSSWGNAGMLVPSYCRPIASLDGVLEAIRTIGSPTPVASVRRPLSLRTLGWLARLAGSARRQTDLATAARLHDLATRSLARYDQMSSAEGIDLGLTHHGWLWLYPDDRALNSAVAEARRLSTIGVSFSVLDGPEICELEPGLAPTRGGGIYYPGDASVDPEVACASILACAQALGSRVLRDRVVSIEDRARTGITVRGAQQHVSVGRVVLAAGAETAALARALGESLPMAAGYGWSLTVPTNRPILTVPIMLSDEHVVVTQRATSIRLTGGMEFGGRRDDPVQPQRLDAMREAATRVLPDLRGLPPGLGWRGARPMTVSGLPLVRALKRNPDVVLCTGHGTLGVTLAPVSAGEVVRVVSGRAVTEGAEGAG